MMHRNKDDGFKAPKVTASNRKGYSQPTNGGDLTAHRSAGLNPGKGKPRGMVKPAGKGR